MGRRVSKVVDGVTNGYLLAHELGHFAGYVGDDNGHSTDPKNVMSGKYNGDTPDEEHCRKVLALFK